MVLGNVFIYIETGKDALRKNGLKGGEVLGEGFIYMETGKDSFRKSGLKQGNVLGEGVIDMESGRHSFRKSSLQKIAGVSLSSGLPLYFVTQQQYLC